MCVSRSWIVISRPAGTSLESPPDPGINTFGFLNSGRYLDTGSVTVSRPSSTRIMTATLVTGLLIEAMREECVGSHLLAGLRHPESPCPEVTELSVASEQGHRSSNLLRSTACWSRTSICCGAAAGRESPASCETFSATDWPGNGGVAAGRQRTRSQRVLGKSAWKVSFEVRDNLSRSQRSGS